MPKRILITGHRGAVGTYLWDYLATTQPDALIFGAGRPSCDLTDSFDTAAALRAANPDEIYHCASMANVAESWRTPRAVFYNNVTSTVCLFERLRELDMRPRVLLASTSEVYGNPATTPIREDAPLAPRNFYAASKLAQENIALINQWAYGVPVVIARAFGYINPLRADLVLTSWARQIAHIERGDRETLYHGALGVVRSMCDVRDVVRGYAMLMAQGVAGEAYNLGAAGSYTLGDLLQLLRDRARVNFRCELDPALVRPIDMTNIIPDCSKIEHLGACGWRPQYTLAESLDWLLEEARAAAFPIKLDRKAK